MVRAKFKCVSKLITEHGATVKLDAVTTGSRENDRFFKYTPSGSVEMGVVEESAAGLFVPGKEYHVDFTSADVE